MEFVCQKCKHQHSNTDLSAEQNDFDPEVIEIFLRCSQCKHERSTLVEISDFLADEDFEEFNE